MVPTQWPLARVTAVYPGPDGHVLVATIKTAKGSYNRPVVKLVLILPNSLASLYSNSLLTSTDTDHYKVFLSLKSCHSEVAITRKRTKSTSQIAR